jgi:hypothetical protein
VQAPFVLAVLHVVFVEMVAYAGIGIVQGSGGNEMIDFPYFLLGVHADLIVDWRLKFFELFFWMGVITYLEE